MSESLVLGLQKSGGCHVGAGIQTWDLERASVLLLTADPPLLLTPLFDAKSHVAEAGLPQPPQVLGREAGTTQFRDLSTSASGMLGLVFH